MNIVIGKDFDLLRQELSTCTELRTLNTPIRQIKNM